MSDQALQSKADELANAVRDAIHGYRTCSACYITTAELSAVLLPALKDVAATAGGAHCARLARIEQIAQKWHRRSDHGFDPDESEETAAFWRGARQCSEEIIAAFAAAGTASLTVDVENRLTPERD